MRKDQDQPRFGPERWVTVRDTGEAAKIEAWSEIAAAYRLRSRKRGLFFATDDELDEVPVHPQAGLGKHWKSCPAPGCGAPLTPDRIVCERCQMPTCSCGRCGCAPKRAASARAKSAAKKAPAAIK